MPRRFSLRLGAIAAVSAVSVITLTTAALLAHPGSQTTSTPLQQILALADQPFQLRLFSGAKDGSGKSLVPGDRTLDKRRDDFTGVDSRYQTNKDKSTVDAHLQPDGKHLAETKSFYPTSSEDEARHPRDTTIYRGDKEIVVEQDLRRFDGTRQQSTNVTADGAKTIIDYADDGSTVIGETKLVPAPFCCDDAPVIKSQKIWLADAEHSLVYSDITGIDGKRTKTKFDTDHQILWVKVCAQSECYASGTKIKGYYPGTNRLRFESTVDDRVDEALYYRQDGTLWYDLKIDSSSNDITFYDSTGLKKVLEQEFFRRDETGHEGAIKITAHSVYEPFVISEFDTDGNLSNTFTLNGTKVHSVVSRNITVNGVLYKEIDLYFNRETDQFDWGAISPANSSAYIPVNKSNFVPPALPRPSPEELKLSVPLYEDDLPVPPPMFYGGH